MKIKKAINYYKNYGFLASFKKVFKTVFSSRKKTTINIKNSLFDVCFINGCSLPHPYRYRVLHQKEQLENCNFSTFEIAPSEICDEVAYHARIFIIYRYACDEKMEKFIKKVKSLNKTVLFDIDDLVIDTIYTDTIPFIQQMSRTEKENYDAGVNGYQKTLKLCDGCITTTEALRDELLKYNKNVFINRNVASDEMLVLSNSAISKKQQNDKEFVSLGYFSGSITHNDDIEMISETLERIFDKYSNVKLLIVGYLSLPTNLTKYKDRIQTVEFCDWTRLPRLISSVDINIVPLRDTIFNRAKSENKWIEASLVKVPTIASNVGAFKQMIKNDLNGILCDSDDDWLEKLSLLIESKELRKRISESAYSYVVEHCVSIVTCLSIKNVIERNIKPNMAMVLPSLNVSGGVLVALKHCELLARKGIDIFIVNFDDKDSILKFGNTSIKSFSMNKYYYLCKIDNACATVWFTNRWINNNSNIIRNHLYLVQNYETYFYKDNLMNRLMANKTYLNEKAKYITISKWCQNWLKNIYNVDAKYIENGIDLERFRVKKRDFSKKIIILIEGDPLSYYKNVDESFLIANKLDRSRFEIWFMSYNGYPKPWYKVDKFFHNISYDKVHEIYEAAHILIKSSILESFSYPPLEMMATGGVCVVRKNDGNIEYLKNKYNCLFYDEKNLDSAIECINKITKDAKFRSSLITNGLMTAQKRSWDKIDKTICVAYFENEVHQV